MADVFKTRYKTNVNDILYHILSDDEFGHCDNIMWIDIFLRYIRPWYYKEFQGRPKVGGEQGVAREL